METLPVFGYATTHSADQLVTDSAASATAMATGRKVPNRVVSLDEDGAPIPTILEAAVMAGYRTGLVTTTRITHATPACFVAHVASRGEECAIARQFLDSGVDLVFGGGGRFFDDELRAAFADKGYRVSDRFEELAEAEDGRLLGLFSSSHMAYELDRSGTEQPSLEAMTLAAIDFLSKGSKRFFLMVEGGRIDHAGHAHDAVAAAADTLAFDRAIESAVERIRGDHDVLVVVTADHTTGALAISERIDVEGMRRVRASAEAIARRLGEGEASLEVLLAQESGIEDLTDEEKTYLSSGEGTYSPANEIAHLVSHRLGLEFYSHAEQKRHESTHGHEGSVVPVYAGGPGASSFGGALDNTDIAKRIASALDLEIGG